MSQKVLCAFGGNFWPPGSHHLEIAKSLANACDLLVIIPSGKRTDRQNAYDFEPKHKAEMVRLNFRSIPNAYFDFSDLEKEHFTPTWFLDKYLKQRFPKFVVKHAVGDDLIKDGHCGKSQIQTTWVEGKRVWEELSFLVPVPTGIRVEMDDLPPHAEIVRTPAIFGRSTLIRRLIKNDAKEAGMYLVPEVMTYINQNHLFRV